MSSPDAPGLLDPEVIPRLNQLAAALEADDPDAAELLRLVEGSDPLELLPWLHRHRVLSAVARVLRRCPRAQELPQALQQGLATARRQAAVGTLLRQQELKEATEALGSAGIRCAVIKGCDLGSRVYDAPGDRIAGDIDLMIEPQALDGGIEVLQRSGWQPRAQGARYHRFLHDEGYCWQAQRPSRPMIELHFRLWGSVPQSFASAVLEDCENHRGLVALRPSLADAYALAAVHSWTDAGPRPLATWWDLQRIARKGAQSPEGEGTMVSSIAQRSVEHGLQLPVALAAQAAAGLYGGPIHPTLVERLEPTLSRLERRLLQRLQERGDGTLQLSSITLAHRLSGRPSRSGWRSLLRRVWAHPGVVERETSPRSPWFLRRLQHLGQRVGWRSSSTPQPR
ncbi:MAG: nucleotidyltransferase family protein [Acidobacteriota bacterium]